MSRNGGGYFKDLGNLSQNFFNQIASDIRSNAEQIVSAAFQNESCGPRGVPPDSASRPGSRTSRRSSRRENTTSNSSSASTPTNSGGGGEGVSSGGGGGGGASREPVSSSTASSQATTPDEVVGDWLHQFVRGGGGSGPSSAGGSSSMGNTGFCGSKHTSTVKPSDNPDLAMLCDICQAKFTLFNRKKLCSECKAYFCGTCVSREAPSGQQDRRIGQTAAFNSRTCKRCKILLSNPPIRADLMELRVKDLQRYLNSKNVNSRSCVEKKDLVELVIRQNGPGDSGGQAAPGVGPSSGGSESSGGGEQPRPRRMPEERQKSFPKAYVESTHRHEWLEKMENAQDDSDIQLRVEEDDQDDFIVVTTSVHPMEPEPESAEEADDDEVRQPPNDSVNNSTTPKEGEQAEETPVQPMDPVSDDEDESNENLESSQEENAAKAVSGDDTHAASDDNDHDNNPSDKIPSPQGAEALPSLDNAPDEIAEEAKEDENETLGDKKSEPTPIPNSLNLPNECPSPMSGSPRRFANQGLVYLSEIQTLEEVNELSVKQAKDILAMNRVNFKGVVEKDELLKHVGRLWRQERQAQDDKESMNDSELCKICMDNPVDCVMLECGHMCTCTTCGKQMAECPICRQYVVRVVRTFKA